MPRLAGRTSLEIGRKKDTFSLKKSTIMLLERV
jgi:hypothetical protein